MERRGQLERTGKKIRHKTKEGTLNKDEDNDDLFRTCLKKKVTEEKLCWWFLFSPVYTAATNETENHFPTSSEFCSMTFDPMAFKKANSI